MFNEEAHNDNLTLITLLKMEINKIQFSIFNEEHLCPGSIPHGSGARLGHQREASGKFYDLPIVEFRAAASGKALL